MAKLSKKEQRLQQAREELGITPPKPIKVRKKRKPLTEEQKEKARENLAKARAARGITGTKNVHPDVLALPEDHTFCYANVKEWLDFNKDKLKSIKGQADSKNSSERMEYQVTQTYVKNLQTYIKDAVWNDCRFGRDREGTVGWKVIAQGRWTRERNGRE